VDLLFALVDKIVESMSVSIGYDTLRAVYVAQLSRTVDTDSISGYNRGVYSTFRDVIEKGIAQGEFRPDGDADALARHCILALRGLIYEWCMRYPDFDFQEMAKQHFALLLRGFTAQPSGFHTPVH